MAFVKNPSDFARTVDDFSLVKGKGNERLNVDQFLTERVMHRNKVVAGRQDEVFSKVLRLLGNVDKGGESAISELTQFAMQENILDDLQREMTLLSSSRGKTLLQKAQELVPISLDGIKLNDPVTWKTFASQNEITNAPKGLKLLDERMTNVWENSALTKRKNFSFQRNIATAAEFMVGKGKQTSSTVGYTLSAGNYAIQLEVMEASEKGFLANFAQSGPSKMSRGSHIFSVQKGFITDAKRTAGGWEAGGIKSFAEAQEDWLRQLVKEVEGLTNRGELTEEKLKSLGKKFKQEVARWQQQVGAAGLLSNKTILPAIQGQLEVTRASREAGVSFTPFLREIPIDPLSSDMAEIMSNKGVHFPGSPQQTAKGKGVVIPEAETALGRGVGVIGSHKEPWKFLKPNVPTTSAHKEAPGIGYKGRFRPTVKSNLPLSPGKTVPIEMQRSIVSYYDPEAKFGNLTAKQAFGEGSVVLKSDVAKSGRLDVQEIATYNIDTHTLKKDPLASPSVVKGVEDFQEGKKSTIRRGAHLGSETGTGKLLSAATDPGTRERIANVSYAQENNQLTIHTEKNISAMLDRKKGIVKQDLRIISETSLIKSMGSVVEGGQGHFKELVGGIATDAEMLFRPDQMNEAFRYRYATAGAAVYSLGSTKETTDALRSHANRSTLEIADIISDQKGTTFAGKTATFVKNQLTEAKFSTDIVDEALVNVLAPYNETGKRLFGKEGKLAFGSDSLEAVQKDLEDIVGPKRAAQILSRKEHQQSLMSFRVPGTSESYGYGNKGTLEPRFFDASKASGLTNVMQELKSRTTDFSEPIAELRTAAEVAEGKLNLSGIEELDWEKAAADPRSYGQGKAKLVKMPKGYGLPSHIYVPSGGNTRFLDHFITGAGISKPKAGRQIYENFFKEVASIQAATDKARVATDSVARFQQEIKSLMGDMVVGESGGGARGELRGMVEGSLNLPNTGIGATALTSQFQEGVEAIEKAGGHKADVMVMSKKAIRKTYDDAITSAKLQGDHQTAALYAKQRERLLDKNYVQSIKTKGPVRMATWRHPGIGPYSLTGAAILPDTSPASELQDYVKGMEYETSFDVEVKNKAGQVLDMESGTVVPQGQKGVFNRSTLVGPMQAMNFDFDGDSFILAAIGEKDSQNELSSIMRGKHMERYSKRHSMIQEISKQNIKSFRSSNKPAHIVSAQAAAAVKTATPQVSNILTEVKHAIANSNVDQNMKIDLVGAFEAAEQNFISSKKLVEAPGMAKLFQDKAKVLRSSIASGNAAQVSAASNELFDFIMGKTVGDVNFYEDGKIADTLSTENMKKSLSNTMSDYATKDSAHKTFFEAFRKTTYGADGTKGIKGAGQDIGKLWEAMQNEPSLNKTVSNVENIINKTRAQWSRGTQSTIAEVTEQTGKRVASKLPTKGIVGIAALTAAGLVAASVSAMTLGPSFSAGSGGKKRTIEDLSAFKEQMNPFLHHGGIYNPPKAYMNAGAQPETRVHLPQGGYSREGVQAMVGSINSAFPAAESRVEIMDGRADMDKHALYRIMNEII